MAAVASAVQYDPAWFERYRTAQIECVARIDAVAKESIDASREVLADLQTVNKGDDPAAWRELRRRAVFTKYLTIYRTLADPAYLDLSIDPDDRAMGSLFAFSRPVRCELWPRRTRSHDDGARLAEYVVRFVEWRQAR